MMILTSWIHEEFGDKDLLDRREKILMEFKLAGDDVTKLRALLPLVKSINDEIDRLTMKRSRNARLRNRNHLFGQDAPGKWLMLDGTPAR